MLGERPPASRPGARAAWDHARLQADRYLARRLRDLDDDQLTRLHARMEAVIKARPPFDPSALEAARRDLNAVERLSAMPTVTAISDQLRRLRRRVETLERAGLSQADWRQRSDEAVATRRRIELERRRRSTSRRPVRRTA